MQWWVFLLNLSQPTYCLSYCGQVFQTSLSEHSSHPVLPLIHASRYYCMVYPGLHQDSAFTNAKSATMLAVMAWPSCSYFVPQWKLQPCRGVHPAPIRPDPSPHLMNVGGCCGPACNVVADAAACPNPVSSKSQLWGWPSESLVHPGSTCHNPQFSIQIAGCLVMQS